MSSTIFQAQNLHNSLRTNGKCQTILTTTFDSPYALKHADPHFGHVSNISYSFRNNTHPLTHASMLLYFKPTLLVKVLVVYIVGGKQLSSGNKCL
jgi:hypothetical protein